MCNHIIMAHLYSSGQSHWQALQDAIPSIKLQMMNATYIERMRSEAYQ